MSLADLLEALGEREAWRAQAACRGLDPSFMYPASIGRHGADGEAVRQARAVCDTCRCVSDCFDAAVANDERYGVWAGLSGRPLRAAIEKRQKELRRQEMMS